MKKVLKVLLILQLTVCCLLLGITIADKQVLQENIIRLHVIADSDSQEDQALKLLVRDAVLNIVSHGEFETAAQARTYLEEKLEDLTAAANRVLLENGSTEKAKVTLCREEFPVRHYETFALPSGVYESLRVTIGSGEGKNWWCVVFPSFCLPAVGDDLGSAAAGAGFSQSLTDTLAGNDGYEFSFFLLDCLGKLENIFFSD